MSPRWNVAEVVSWIAYRDPQPIGNWGKFVSWSYDWPVKPPDSLLDPLRSLARGRKLKGLDISIETRAEHFVNRTRLTATTLVKALRADLRKKLESDNRINTAMSELKRA